EVHLESGIQEFNPKRPRLDGEVFGLLGGINLDQEFSDAVVEVREIVVGCSVRVKKDRHVRVYADVATWAEYRALAQRAGFQKFLDIDELIALGGRRKSFNEVVHLGEIVSA